MTLNKQIRASNNLDATPRRKLIKLSKQLYGMKPGNTKFSLTSETIFKDGVPVKTILDPVPPFTPTDLMPPVAQKNGPPLLKKAKKISNEATRSPGAMEILGAPNTTFLTVKQTAQRFPIFTEAAIRDLIFKAEGQAKYPDASKHLNGFLKVIFRVPGQRRVLLCEPALIEWLRSGQQTSIP
ncbi:hypothetical protein [Undibacterium sp. TJN19]|uniref:hypothetical protein n=1 Tax=Undibacterium sp. TJN19 TaxID=3413055 RepID=UPI003BF35E53